MFIVADQFENTTNSDCYGFYLATVMRVSHTDIKNWNALKDHKANCSLNLNSHRGPPQREVMSVLSTANSSSICHSTKKNNLLTKYL